MPGPSQTIYSLLPRKPEHRSAGVRLLAEVSSQAQSYLEVHIELVRNYSPNPHIQSDTLINDIGYDTRILEIQINKRYKLKAPYDYYEGEISDLNQIKFDGDLAILGLSRYTQRKVARQAAA